jgi:two-component system, chemotaxis family, chemotaxis protein CheY
VSAKRRVLIVEDSAAMRHLLSLAVQRLPGVAIDEAADGVAALKALRAASAAPYDLVFLDLNMPRMDGLKLLGLLQGDAAVARTTIAVVTTTESAETERQARSLGARYFIRKPVSRRSVDKILSEVFGWVQAMS